MIVAEVSQNGNSFEISAPTPYLFFDGEDINRKEKNWVPFAYENNLYLGYSINPHTIYLKLAQQSPPHKPISIGNGDNSEEGPPHCSSMVSTLLFSIQ
jgi:hypothetical protein